MCVCFAFLELASTRTVFVATARRVDTFWELESESASELQQSRIPTVQACGNGVPGSGSGTEPELRSACSAGCSRSDIAPSG